MIISLVGLVLIVAVSQYIVELNALTPLSGLDASTLREQRERDKLAAEIRKIRSDTAGSLIWMLLFAVFVTVGGAIGGFLLGTISREFPIEWRVSNDEINQRIESQIVLHTKDVLAIALAIEENNRVLKAITINLVKHRLTEDAIGEPIVRTKSGTPFNDTRGLDLSFTDADLREADFARDTIKGVNIEGAKIAGANFSDVNIEDTRLDVLVNVSSIDVAL